MHASLSNDVINKKFFEFKEPSVQGVSKSLMGILIKKKQFVNVHQRTWMIASFFKYSSGKFILSSSKSKRKVLWD